MEVDNNLESIIQPSEIVFEDSETSLALNDTPFNILEPNVDNAVEHNI